MGEEAVGKGAGGALLTPKPEPEELAVSQAEAAPATEESSSSSEEEPPSSPEPPRPTKRPRLGETVHLVKCLPRRHEDLSLHPTNQI